MGDMEQIYLDHNSTTPLDPSVQQVMCDCLAAGYVNPASQHRWGQRARQALENYREMIVSMLGGQTTGMETDQLIITSGGTESNNLALMGLAMSSWQTRKSKAVSAEPGRVLVSAVEHPSLVGTARHLAQFGFDVRKIGVDRDGLVRLDLLGGLLAKDPVDVVSIMLANNETGVLQNIEGIAAICRDRNILLHTDAVQAVAKIPVDFLRLGVDAMTFTAHKFNGPRGVGGLLVRHGVRVQPILYGGFQQGAIRPGTEDVALVGAMAQALRLFDEDPERMKTVEHLRDQLQSFLVSEIEGAVVVGGAVDRVPQTLNISFAGIDRQALLMAADVAGLAISTGSACASGSSEASPVLLAMGLPGEVIEGSIRISLGVSNSAAEIAETGRRILKLTNDLRQRK